MKGLSINHAELVSRFLSQERQRLGRSMASCSFQNEMRRQSDLLTGGPSSRVPVSTQTGGNTLAVRKRLNERLSEPPRTLFGVDKSEKPELEIADPLLLQEILAAFSASAETRRKAADRTGDQGALPVEDLIAMLEKGEHEAFSEGEFGEEIPAEVFRKLIETIRWSDDKHKAFANAENLAPQAAYDRRSVIETLKNLMERAQTRRDIPTASQPLDTFSAPGDRGSPRDALGLAGVSDSVPEDFKDFWADGSFSLWRRPTDEWKTSENAEADEATYGEADSSLHAENRQPHPQADFLGADIQSNSSEAFHSALPIFPEGISQDLARPLPRSASPQGPILWKAGLGVTPDKETLPSVPLPSPEGAFDLPDRDLPPWEIFNRPSAPLIGTAPHGATVSSVQSRTAYDPVESSDASPAASLNMADEVHEIFSDFSKPFDAANAEDLFTERRLFGHDLGKGSGSPAGDSSPFGESPRENGNALFQAAYQGSAEGLVFSEPAAAPMDRTMSSSPSATLSFLNADWPREFGQKLSHWARSGKSFMTLELQPESLGKLFLRVETDGTRVSAVVQAEHPEAREILQRNTASLKEVLAEHGLQLSRFSVDVRQENTAFAERNLARWAHDEPRTPSKPWKGDEGENLMNVLHVFDAGLGRALSVRV
ncbi:MAG: flagellar hook-length control protein FliK [Desulfosoma sp.]